MKLFTWLIFSVWIVGFISCKGQVDSSLSKEKVNASKIFAAEKPKLVKTQGSNPGDNVHCSIQDQSGNLWFGTTYDGLYKYNGQSFIQFTEIDGLSSNMVHHLMEDKEGKIWIATSEGVCVYDGYTFSKIQIPLQENKPANTYNNRRDVFSIMQAKNGKLWLATIDGVFIYDGKSFIPFKVNEGVGGFLSSNNNVEYILEDNDGNIWFGGRVNEGVFRYDGHTITNLKPNGDNWAWPVLQDRKGNIWFSNWSGAYRFDGSSFTSFTKNEGLSGNVITRMIEDSKGHLWFGGDGLCSYDGTSFTCFTTKDGLLNTAIWSILEDKTGNIWIGTRNTDLSLYDGNTFTSFSGIE